MRPENETSDLSFIERARRAQIARATERAVAKHGYAQTSLAKIAAEGELSKSVISYHFDSKNDLMRHVADTFFEEAWEAMHGALDSEVTHSEQIRRWIALQIDFFVAHRERFLAAIDIITNLRDDAGRLLYSDYAQDELDAVEEILRAGQAAGEFRAFDVAGYAAVIVAMTETVLGAWLMDPSIDIRPRTEATLDFVHHALMEGNP